MVSSELYSNYCILLTEGDRIVLIILFILFSDFENQMTKNKLNFENAKKQVEIFLPDDMKGPILKAMDICSKKAEVVKNACDTVSQN